MPHPRIFVEWSNGAMVNSEDPDFQAVVIRNTAEYGAPTTVEYRTAYEGPSLVDDDDTDPVDECDQCCSKDVAYPYTTLGYLCHSCREGYRGSFRDIEEG